MRRCTRDCRADQKRRRQSVQFIINYRLWLVWVKRAILVRLHPTRAFAKTLRAIRREKRISQEKLAEDSDLHAVYISLLEGGKRNPSLETLFKICGALKVKPAEFVRLMENASK